MNKDNDNLSKLEITFDEVMVIKLIDIKKKSLKSCAKEMNLSVDEVSTLLSSAREKLAISLIDGKMIVILEKEIENIINTICTFRCAICGEIYTIDYTKAEIICPLCLSSKIMTNKEAGFCK